jgi:bacteriorhodopsin
LARRRLAGLTARVCFLEHPQLVRTLPPLGVSRFRRLGTPRQQHISGGAGESACPRHRRSIGEGRRSPRRQRRDENQTLHSGTLKETPMTEISLSQYSFVYNALSFGIAAMGAATVFFFLGRSQVSKDYRLAVTVTGLVTLIATYHYFRIFQSWEAAYSIMGSKVTPTGQPFNDAYRYVDWLLTVPLLLVELILVMKLPPKETYTKSVRLGVLAAVMVALGYPGEVAGSLGARWIWWVLAMIPFVLIVYELFFGLRDSIQSQPQAARGMVSAARWITVLSWCFYPLVYLFPMVGLSGGAALTGVQVGYTLADLIAKAAFGVFIYFIALRKSEVELSANRMVDKEFVAAE